MIVLHVCVNYAIATLTDLKLILKTCTFDSLKFMISKKSVQKIVLLLRIETNTNANI